jgi:hypothetical protein
MIFMMFSSKICPDQEGTGMQLTAFGVGQRRGVRKKGDVMKWMFVIVAVCCLGLIGCAQQAEEPEVVEEVIVPEWERVLPGLMTETQKAQQELILTATNALASEMMAELMAALDESGPAGGIGVCRDKAPAVAAHVSETYGVQIGRTSHMLRNTANVAPDWAAGYVADKVEDPTWLGGPEGELGALLPIRLKAECQMCHGPVDGIDEEVLAAIAESYPEDQAVGFAEGDLRGWFWVEAPPGEAEIEESEI